MIPGIYIPKPLRENDQNIMGELLKLEKAPYQFKESISAVYSSRSWLSEMTDPQGNTVLPEFLDFTGNHTDISRSNLRWPIQARLPPKSWEIWKKLIHKRFLWSKKGGLGTATLEEPLGPYLQTHDDHCTWHWEQTGALSIVKNTFLFGEHQQKHYAAQFTRHQIKVNRKDILHKAQLILHGYPMSMQQSTGPTLVFA
jgi:hypothetical protein